MATCRTIWARMLHTSSTLQVASKWRVRRGFAPSSNEYGPLTDLPDFTFIDGRPTPLSLRQRQRAERNVQMGLRAKELLTEVRYAESVFNEQKRAIQERDEATRRSLLQAKGDALKAPKLDPPKRKSKK